MAELALTARSVAPRRIFSPLCHAEAPLLAGTCLVQPCLLAYFDVFLGFSESSVASVLKDTQAPGCS